ncbi:hypothetical protein VitviT2T_011490 [Vitis vinifera]|uniref:Cytochrome P450 71D10 n=1 Tax=Vitis vinifera TaxID=29760 RepID=A0ABY9CCC6_VITVI|nr:hypothetical protein VitviT2T_011490 [Vitis vinifera]
MEFSSSSVLFPFLLFLFMLFRIACWFTSSSLTEGLGREIWASHAPTAWPSLHASPQIAKEVMKTHDLNFAQRPHLLVTRIVTYDSTDIAFAPYGDYWRQLRKICVIELLSAKRVRSFQLIRKEEVSNLIRFIDSCSRFPIDLREKISSFTFAVISKAALGKEFKEQDSLESVLEEGTKLASGLMEHRERMEKRTGELEAEEDFIDVLLKLQQDGDLELPLTDDNIKAVILDIFSGGGACNSIDSCGVGNVGNDEKPKRDVDETGIDELKFLKAVVSETLRLHPPFPLLLPRECREKCKINGYEVPVKTRMTINAWAIGRDPDYWTEAERFYPERFLDSSVDYKGADFGFIPFDAGRRMCPGILFAIPSIELPLAHLLFHFDWELPNGMRHEDLDMTEVHGLSAKRKHSLHLIPIPYNS